MNETQLNYQLLAVFAAVVEHESFSRAAEALGVSKGTVSRAISRLEAQLGVELLHRTTHHVAISTAGAALYERTGHHLLALRNAVAQLPELDDEPSGLLRITAPSDFGALVLPPIVASFTRRYPGVRFDIRLTSEHVDVIKEGYDLAIRLSTRPLKDSTLKLRRAGRSALFFYASPQYIARHGKPKHVGDDRHTWVAFSNVMRPMGMTPESTQFLVDDFFLARDLIREGVGVGPLPDFIARAFVLEGRLEEITMTGYQPVVGKLMLLFPSRGQTPKKVTLFCEHFIEVLRKGF